VATLNRECKALSAHAKWQELASVSAQWAGLEPQKAEPWLFRAQAAEGLEDWENVVQSLDKVPRADSRAVAALVGKAVAEFEHLNRPWDGAQTCDEALRIDPRVLTAHQQTIFFYAMTLQRAEMVRRIRQAIQVRRESPESYVYLVAASWLYSSSVYRHNTKWLESDPDNETFQVARALQVYVSEAKLDLGRAAEFEHIPPDEQLLQQYPHNLELVAYFLNRCISEGDLDRVRELLAAVPSPLADVDARFWRARAWCDDADGDFSAAEKSLRRAFELDPYWWQVHFQLHDLLRRLGRPDESAKFFEMYRISKALRAEITTLTHSVESLNGQKFFRSMLELAKLVEDHDVASALRERLSGL
jgi:tetratricopeptide (TPR) repeat protein